MARDEVAEAIFVAYVMAAIWGAGNEAMPLAAGTAHGSVSRDRDQDRRVFVCPDGTPLLCTDDVGSSRRTPK